MDQNPSDVLTEARKAFEDKAYAIALEKYQWFFENAIKIRPSLYGVRLSYCLIEWAELSKEHPPAKDALIQLKEKSLKLFHGNLSREHFHEYSSIAEYLGDSKEVFREFLRIHESDTKLAATLFPYVYEYCAEHAMWEICKKYWGDGKKQYESALHIFDHVVEFSKQRTNEISETAFDSFKKETIWILTALKNANATNEYMDLLSTLESNLKERNMENLYLNIKNEAPNLTEG